MKFQTKIKQALILFFLIFAQNSFANEDLLQITPLMQATSEGDLSAISFFARIDENAINKQNIGGATALHIAARNNDFEATKLLLSLQADPNISDIEGYNPAMRATSLQNYEVLYLLLQNGGDISHQNQNGDNLLLLSAKNSCDQCLNVILDLIVPDQNFRNQIFKFLTQRFS